MPTHAKVYISLVSAAGIAAMAFAFLDPPWSYDSLRLLTYLLLAVLAAGLKLRLPGLTGTMSIGFVFVLYGVSEFTLPETMLIAAAGTLVQCMWRPKTQPSPVQVLFSVCTVATSMMLAYGAVKALQAGMHASPVSIVLAVATCVYFVANSLLVSGVLSLVKQEPLRVVWQQCYLFAFPYYLLGGVVAGLMAAAAREFGWKPSLLILPVMGLIFLFYRLYLARWEMLPAAGMARVSMPAAKAKSA